MILELIDGTADDIVDAYRTIRGELAGYGHGLVDKPEIVGLNKIDAMTPDDVKRKCRALMRAAGRSATVLPLSASAVPAVVGTLLRSSKPRTCPRRGVMFRRPQTPTPTLPARGGGGKRRR